MIYAPPELAKHLAALERLRRHDATDALLTAGGIVSSTRFAESRWDSADVSAAGALGPTPGRK